MAPAIGVTPQIAGIAGIGISNGELAEVLGCGGEVELVVGAVRSSQPQPVELEKAFPTTL